MSADNRLGETRPRAVLLAVRFGTEIALLAVLAITGADASTGLGGRIALAVGAPTVVALIWGLAISPRAWRRMPDPWRLIVEFVLFGGAGAALAAENFLVGAVTFGAISIGVALLLRIVAPGS
jgi:hypothetical protein